LRWLWRPRLHGARAKLPDETRPGDRHLSAGRNADIYGRVMSVELSKLWNQSVVVENAPARGTIGTDLCEGPAGRLYAAVRCGATITIAPHLYSKLPYDPVRDFAPDRQRDGGAVRLMANPAVPGRTT